MEIKLNNYQQMYALLIYYSIMSRIGSMKFENFAY